MPLSPDQIKEMEQISIRTIENYAGCLKAFREVKATMTTREVAKFLGMSREWVQKNKTLLQGQRSNKRGDLKFNTERILQYKLQQQ